MSQADIETLEVQMDQAKDAIELRDAVRRLINNKDFQKVILEGYFEKEPARLVALLSDPSMQIEDRQVGLKNSMIGIGQLQMHFRFIESYAQQMEAAMQEDEETHTNMMAEAI